MRREPSIDDFEQALSSLRPPRGRQPDFLRAHLKAKGRALNMRRIAEAAGYRSWRGGNLQYGLLAERIGRQMGYSNADINLLVEFIEPRGKRSREDISNDEWILVMRPAFADALKRVRGWI